MARDLTAALATALEGHPQLCVLVEAEFTSGFLRIWSGLGEKSWNGNTWSGVGGLLGISAIQETAEIVANAVRISLSGIPAEHISRALDECRTAKTASVWFGALDENSEIIADPYLSFAGRIDVPTATDGQAGCAISITIEGDLADLQRPRVRRYTKKDQAILYPEDTGFDYVESIQDWNGAWGKPAPATGGGGGCFSGNVLLKEAGRFDQFSHGQIIDVLTLVGWRQARVETHEHVGPMLDMGNGELVTRDHPIRKNFAWLPAERTFSAEVQYSGLVYNLHVLDEDEGACNFCLANGHVAHNKMNPLDR